MQPRLTPRTLICTCLALVAFAANSLLCRAALNGTAGEATIDAASFTAVRIVSGSVMLIVTTSGAGRIFSGSGPIFGGSILHSSQTTTENLDLTPSRSGSWASGAMLFLYAITFSLSYHSLTAGTGAILLFGAVQVTMILFALWSGERPRVLEWIGLALALGGLFYLVSPGLEAPSLVGSLLMTIAGIAWGFYSVRGRGTTAPIADTAGNFLRAAPWALATSLLMCKSFQVTSTGVLLAATSGALTSGVGYTLWYVALRGLTVTRAALVQLSVPILAAIAGLILLNETITLRLILSALLILGGIALAVLGREHVGEGKSR